MSKLVIGKDSEGKNVNVIWGDNLNWAHGFVDSQGRKQEYYRAQGRNDIHGKPAHYVVVREVSDEFRYWYVVTHIDGKTNHLPTELMNAYEGQEVCQIMESERARDISKERAHTRIEDKSNE